MSQSQPSEDPEWMLPLDYMEIGESFFIPTVRPALMLYNIENKAKKYRVKVKVYVTTHNGWMGVRVWRLTD